MTKPLLKWPGGKRRQASHIADLVGEVRGTYVEPFAGSLAVFLELAERGHVNHAVLSDANERLIDFYVEVRDRPGDLLDALATLPEGNDKASYYEIRETFNAHRDSSTLNAARFLWLNRACFNGLYRVNRSGGFNVPCGTHKARLSFPTREHVRQVAGHLKRAQLMSCGFSAYQFGGEVTYCDPPYVETFDGYTAEGFSMEDQGRLVSTAEDSFSRVIISNSPAARPLFDELWSITEITEKRSIAADKNARGKVREIIAILD